MIRPPHVISDHARTARAPVHPTSGRDSRVMQTNPIQKLARAHVDGHDEPPHRA